MSLSYSDFPRFFQAVCGYSPFPWQLRLLLHLLQTGRYPDTLALGTGTGKTSIIIIHIFALAVEASMAPNQRRVPTRITVVTDRRVVVDQTFLVAEYLALILKNAEQGIIKQVADALRSLTSTGIPLVAARLRGGERRGDSWSHWPDQPLVLSATVDQIGSRLLFRAYGVTPRMSAIHAGLIGADNLIVLDEAHLSRAFLQTLRTIQEHYRQHTSGILPDRWAFMTMSATPSDAYGDVFRLDEEDLKHPVLKRRYQASKPTRLVRLSGKGSKTVTDRQRIVKACVKEVCHFVENGHTSSLAVLNTVGLARDVWKALSSHKAILKSGAEVHLITGRMRNLDKERFKSVLHKVRAPRTRAEDPDKPVIVVSTQTIEAGPDVDFSSVVLQSASYDALMQRMGRNHRMGLFEYTEAVILCPQEGGSHPIYGGAIDAAIAFLEKHAVEDPETKELWVEMSQANMDECLRSLSEEEYTNMCTPKVQAPVLLPNYMLSWLQTRPRPSADPDPDPFLHGKGQRTSPDVNIAWRSDLSEEVLQKALQSEASLEDLCALVGAVPPGSIETLPLPIYAIRSWLNREKAPLDVSDVSTEDPGDADPAKDPLLLLRWDGEDTSVVYPWEIRVGDVLLAPSNYGGLTSSGVWGPTETAKVPDLGDQTQWVARNRAVLRTSIYPDLPYPASTDAVAWLTRAQSLEGWRSEVATHLLTTGYTTEEVGGHTLLCGKTRKGQRPYSQGEEETYAKHTEDVVQLVKMTAYNLGFPEEIIQDFTVAGGGHDLGKLDLRFQFVLVGGDPVRLAMLEEPLAKSGKSHRKKIQDAIYVSSGYPKGTRHELMSLAMLQTPGVLKDDEVFDRDLVLHLISSHHGWCRPVAPVVLDPDPVEITFSWNGETHVISSAHELAQVGSGVAQRFADLNEKYGPYQVAWMEAIFQRADHMASAQASKEKP